MQREKTGKWQKLTPFFLNNDEYSVGHPALSPDGKTLYFVSDMKGGEGGTDIYSCAREGEKWSNPANLGPVINTFGNEMFRLSPTTEISILHPTDTRDLVVGSLRFQDGGREMDHSENLGLQ